MTDFEALELGYDIPARPGMAEADIQTPALIVDLDAFEHNLATMQAHANAMGLRLRPHAKTHKSADVALAQIAAGAVGICCQKVSEAEALVRAGVPDILISNEVRDPVKIHRLARLATRARIAVCVDDPAAIADLAAAAERHGARIDCLVEIDVGGGRCGLEPGTAAVDLACVVATAPGLHFAGLQAYNGAAQHIRDHNSRQQAIAAVIAKTEATVVLLRAAGLTCETIAGAGTGSFPFEGESGLFNELQCGSYCFMDAAYDRVRGPGNDRIGGFKNALFVLTAVMSKTRPGHAVCDAGLKVLTTESGLPRLDGPPRVSYVDASDEHGLLDDPADRLSVGDRLRLVPGHCDPTCNLHDWYVGVRGGVVECLWAVTARGKSW